MEMELQSFTGGDETDRQNRAPSDTNNNNRRRGASDPGCCCSPLFQCFPCFKCYMYCIVMTLIIFIIIIPLNWDYIEDRWHDSKTLEDLKYNVFPNIGHRLPTHLIPASYALLVKLYVPGYGYDATDGKNATFEGDVEIFLKNFTKTQIVVLSARDLNIDKSRSYVMSGPRRVGIRWLKYNSTNQQVVIRLKDSIRTYRPCSIRLFYTGSMDTKLLRGPVLKKRSANQTHYFFTSFETTYARGLVPCFDEPTFKASWNISVIHPEGTVALSNTMNDGPTVPAGPQFLRTDFEETPILPTYTVAITVSDYPYMEKYTKKGVRMRVYAPKEELYLMSTLLNQSCKSLDFYEDYFEIPHGLKKLDWFSINDVPMGGMESWGLFLVHGGLAGFNPDVTPRYSYEGDTLVVHEISHLYFSNMVTMKWWDEVWLNEGFATLYEVDGLQRTASWKYTDNVMQSMHIELQPKLPTMKDPSVVHQNYDDYLTQVPYKKGAAILRMLQLLIGEDEFHRCTKHYIRSNMFKNTNLTIFLKSYPAEIQGVKTADFMQQWLTLSGHPLVTLDEEPDGSAWIVDRDRERHPQNITIPIWYEEHHGEKGFRWLAEKPIRIPKTQKFLLIDPDFNGLYHVNYTLPMWFALGTQIVMNMEEFSMNFRARFLYDSMRLKKRDDEDHQLLAEAIRFMKLEKEWYPWRVMMYVVGEHPPKVINASHYLGSLRLEKMDPRNHIMWYLENRVTGSDWDKLRNIEYPFMFGCRKNERCDQAFMEWFLEKRDKKCTKETTLNQCTTLPLVYRPQGYCLIARKVDDWKKLLRWHGNELDPKERLIVGGSFKCRNFDDAFLAELTQFMANYANEQIEHHEVLRLLNSTFVETNHMDIFVNTMTEKCYPWPIVDLFLPHQNRDDLVQILRMAFDRASVDGKQKLKECCEKSDVCDLFKLTNYFSKID